MILALVLSVIPGIVLIIQNGINLHSSLVLLKERIKIREDVLFSMEIARVIHAIQYESGVTSLYVSTGEDNEIYPQLTEAYERTDGALHALSKWKLPNTHRQEMRNKNSYHNNLRHFRATNGSQSMHEILTFYSEDIQLFIDLMTNAVKEEKHSDIWPDLVAYNMLINGKESVGLERSLGTFFFINGGLDLKTLLWFKGAHEMALRYFKKFSEYSLYGKSLQHAYINEDLKHVVDSMRHEVLGNFTRDYSVSRGLKWMDNMTSYVNELDVINRNMETYIHTKTEEEIFHYNLDVVLDIVILLLTVIIVPLLLFFIFKIIKKVETIRKHLEEKTVNLENEQQRTEILLSQLVPNKIARKMRGSHVVVPEFFHNVTVLVSDISNFEMFLSRSTPSELIEVVRTVFDVIDRRLAAYNVSKIGSIGNLMYVASGLNNEHGAHHVTTMADLALDIMEKTRQIRASHMLGEGVKMAIGINTGAVTAGVINGTVPRYCLYGQTVIETFNLMAACLSGHIQISENTYQLLKPSNSYSIKPRDDLHKTRKGENHPRYYILLGSKDKIVVHVDLEADCADA